MSPERSPRLIKKSKRKPYKVASQESKIAYAVILVMTHLYFMNANSN